MHDEELTAERNRRVEEVEAERARTAAAIDTERERAEKELEALRKRGEAALEEEQARHEQTLADEQARHEAALEEERARLEAELETARESAGVGSPEDAERLEQLERELAEARDQIELTADADRRAEAARAALSALRDESERQAQVHALTERELKAELERLRAELPEREPASSSSPASVVLVADAISTSVSSPGAATPAKFTVLLCRDAPAQPRRVGARRALHEHVHRPPHEPLRALGRVPLHGLHEPAHALARHLVRDLVGAAWPPRSPAAASR